MHKSLKLYPFLSEIPEALLRAIDLGVLHLPAEPELVRIAMLSKELEANIVIYSRDHISKGMHLCRVLKPAPLTGEELERLNGVEKLFANGLVIVAYDKPLRLAAGISPNLSQAEPQL